MDNSISFLFRHSKAALLTKHQKEKLIGPLVKHFLGIEVIHTDKYDTDLYGTFTRDIARTKSQVDTLREKARKGMELCGLEIGIASEGSFAADPIIGMIPWNLEMVMLYDEGNDMEIIGQSGQPFKPLQKPINGFPALVEIAKSINFPQNGLIMRPDDEASSIIFKEASNFTELESNFVACLRVSEHNTVFVEQDLRSHKNAARRRNIEFAVIDLINKCNSFCPECHSPGFGVDSGRPGLPCSLCGEQTASVRFIIYKCRKCGFELEIERKDRTVVGPENCSYCNP